MALTLADVLNEHWPDYLRAKRCSLTSAHHRAVAAVLSCRKPALGGRLFRCGGCSRPHFAYHSCNHRSCPQCGALDQQIWSAKQEARLLPVSYFMVTFTIPDKLRSLCLAFPRELYALMLTQSAAALKDVVATKARVPMIQPGITSVLHTWGRQMQHHPHVHAIVPAVAINRERNTLVESPRDEFLVHFRPLAARFRSLMHAALKERHPEIYQALTPDQRHALSSAKHWNVQLQPAGRGNSALRYLARYVQRSAFSPKRLLGYDHAGNVLLSWTSSATGQRGVLRLHPHEFIRRWLIHVLPKRFTRVRHYGFLSSAARKARLRVRLLVGASFNEPQPVLPELKAFTCDHCGGELCFEREIKRLHPHRGPPTTALYKHQA